MKFFKLSVLFFISALFLTACNSSQSDQISYEPQNQSEIAQEESANLASENLDLQAVGNLLEKADDAEEFEYLLNNEEGVNNLDLNGDGYTDYISVAEFDDRDSNQRGFTLFDRFGADEIQEIARIIFDRDRYDEYGTRILLNGNEQLYGDNYYYETNWQDRNPPIADWVFSDRDNYYQSPYYYENYPDYYENYRVVETPVYRTRIEEYNYAPVFVKTVSPTITKIRVNSPYRGRTSEKIFAKLAKPTKEQKEFRKNNPNRPEFVQVKNDKIDKNQNKFDNKFENKADKNRNKFENFRKENNEKAEKFDKPNKPERRERENVKPNKAERIERPNMKPDKPNKVERQNVQQNKPNKPNNEAKQNGNGKQNRGNGNGGGGNGKGGGGKKGKN